MIEARAKAMRDKINGVVCLFCVLISSLRLPLRPLLAFSLILHSFMEVFERYRVHGVLYLGLFDHSLLIILFTLCYDIQPWHHSAETMLLFGSSKVILDCLHHSKFVVPYQDILVEFFK
jgi:hypothetical protein